MESKPITLGSVAGVHTSGLETGPRTERGPAEIKGVATSYIQLCKGQGRNLTSRIEPAPGEWLLRADGELELAGDPPRALAKGEVVIPRLERLLALLREQIGSLALDYQQGDFACLAFDPEGRSIANVVSRNPEEAALRALLFILAERAANEPAG